MLSGGISSHCHRGALQAVVLAVVLSSLSLLLCPGNILHAVVMFGTSSCHTLTAQPCVGQLRQSGIACVELVRMCSGSRAAKRRRDAEEEAAAAQAAEDKRSRYELALEKANQAAELARRGPQGGGSDDMQGIGADDEDEQLQRNLLKVLPLPSLPSATPFFEVLSGFWTTNSTSAGVMTTL